VLIFISLLGQLYFSLIAKEETLRI